LEIASATFAFCHKIFLLIEDWRLEQMMKTLDRPKANFQKKGDAMLLVTCFV